MAAEQRKGMAFLVANMPARDLETLQADFLLSNTALWNQASADSLAYFERNHSSTEVLARYARLLEELVP